MNISSEMLAHDQGQSHYIAYDNFSKWEKNPEVISKKCNLMLQLYLVKKCVNTEWDVREIFIVLLKLWSKDWAIHDGSLAMLLNVASDIITQNVWYYSR